MGGETPLSGVIATPDFPDPPEQTPAVLLLNAGLLHRVGPHRMYVRIARTLTKAGVTSLRFDYSGIGESPPRKDLVPAPKSRVIETNAAMDHMASVMGAQRFVLMGLCSGAVNAFRVARLDPRVIGLVLIDGFPYRTYRYYLIHYARRLFRLRSWLNVLSGRRQLWKSFRRVIPLGGGTTATRPATALHLPPKAEIAAGFRELVHRGVRFCVIHSGGFEQYYNYTRQFVHSFRSVDFDGHLKLVYFKHSDHTFTSLEQQRLTVNTIEDWMEKEIL